MWIVRDDLVKQQMKGIEMEKLIDFAIFTRDQFLDWQKEEKRMIAAIQPMTTGVSFRDKERPVDADVSISVFVTFFIDKPPAGSP